MIVGKQHINVYMVEEDSVWLRVEDESITSLYIAKPAFVG